MSALDEKRPPSQHPDLVTEDAAEIRDDVRDAELILTAFRTLLLVVLAIAPRIFNINEAYAPHSILLIAAAAIYNIVMGVACLFPSRFGVRRSLVVAMDTTLITAWIHFSGRYELVPFYYVVVVVAAMWGQVFGGVMAAAVCNFLFLYLWGREAADVNNQNPLQFPASLAVNSALLFVVGTLAGFISEAQDRERVRRLERELLIANYQQEIDISGELQPLLLSRFDKLGSSFDIGAALQTARSMGGGDYLDALPLPGGRVLLCVGDVSGKSVRAQARVPLLKYSLRALAPLHPRPAELMARLQSTLAPDIGPELYIALCLIVLDAEMETLTWCNAGHIAPLLVRPKQELVPLETTCPALGLFPEIPPEAKSCDWCPQQALLLFTDGLSDALSFGGQVDGEEQVRKLAQRLVDENRDGGNLKRDERAARDAQSLVDFAQSALDDKSFVAKHFTMGQEFAPDQVHRDDIAVLVAHFR